MTYLGLKQACGFMKDYISRAGEEAVRTGCGLNGARRVVELMDAEGALEATLSSAAAASVAPLSHAVAALEEEFRFVSSLRGAGGPDGEALRKEEARIYGKLAEMRQALLDAEACTQVDVDPSLMSFLSGYWQD